MNSSSSSKLKRNSSYGQIYERPFPPDTPAKDTSGHTALKAEDTLFDFIILSQDDTPQEGGDVCHTRTIRKTHVAIPFLRHHGVGTILLYRLAASSMANG